MYRGMVDILGDLDRLEKDEFGMGGEGESESEGDSDVGDSEEEQEESEEVDITSVGLSKSTLMSTSVFQQCPRRSPL